MPTEISTTKANVYVSWPPEKVIDHLKLDATYGRLTRFPERGGLPTIWVNPSYVVDVMECEPRGDDADPELAAEDLRNLKTVLDIHAEKKALTGTP